MEKLGNNLDRKTKTQIESEQFFVSSQEKNKFLFTKPEIVKEEYWEKYKNIRLDAVKDDPEAFSSSLEKELKKTEQEWRKDLSNTDDKFFVTIDDVANNKEAVSMAGAIKAKEGMWRLISVYTKKDFRRNGFSKEIIEKILEEIKNEKNGKEVYLFVNKSEKQDNAIKLYEKLGFKIVSLKSAIEKYKKISWYVMELKLNEDKK